MEYKVEEISPVERRVDIKVTPEEVDAAVLGAATLLRESVKLDGFRKGKAPLQLVEKHFHDKIYDEAQRDLVNVHINEVLQKLDATPISGINIKGTDRKLEKGKEYEYTLDFEILPQFELPQYEGLTVEQETGEVKDEDVEKVLQKIRERDAKIVPVDGTAPAKNGQIANIDFEFFEDGKPVEDYKVSGFNLELGAGEALEDFENIVRGIPVGNTGEGPIHFPEDFIDEKIAGKTLTAKITVHAVKERDLPALDDEFAKKRGSENLEQFKKSVRDDLNRNLVKLQKGAAQQKLLDQMLKMTDFPLPPSLVKMEQRLVLTDLASRLESQGRALSALGKTLDQLLEDAKPRAEEMTRSQVLLLSIAKKENLNVTDQEVNLQIFSNCMRSGEDYKTVIRNMEESGMIYEMRDRLLADKAMDRVYEKANVIMVEGEESDQQKETAKAENASEDTGAATIAPANAASEETGSKETDSGNN